MNGHTLAHHSQTAREGERNEKRLWNTFSMCLFVKKWYSSELSNSMQNRKNRFFLPQVLLLVCLCSSVPAAKSNRLCIVFHVSAEWKECETERVTAYTENSSNHHHRIHIWLCSMVSFSVGTYGIRNASVNIKDKFSVIFHIQRVTESWGNDQYKQNNSQCFVRMEICDLVSTTIDNETICFQYHLKICLVQQICALSFSSIVCRCCVRFATRQRKREESLSWI